MDTPKILKESEIKVGLKKLPGWKYRAHKISKEFVFADFMGSFSFLSGLVSYFEKVDHHPDIHIFYSKIIFELQRFDAGNKVTDRDFQVAHEIEKHFKTRQK